MKKLSKRETEIMYYLKNGWTNKMIADEMKIDQKTVSTYVQRIRLKLNLDSWANHYKIVSTWIRSRFPND